MIEISEAAQGYLRTLLEKQEVEGTGIRVFVANPGTPSAETCIAYCRPGEAQEDDIPMAFTGFTAWFEKRSEPFLAEAVVDFQEDKLGGQLTIKAPNARVPKVDENSPLEDRVNYILYNEINPSLAAHGGMVSLIEIVDVEAVLQFGGGCQGCAAKSSPTGGANNGREKQSGWVDRESPIAGNPRSVGKGKMQLLL